MCQLLLPMTVELPALSIVKFTVPSPKSYFHLSLFRSKNLPFFWSALSFPQRTETPSFFPEPRFEIQNSNSNY